ncbi:MAG TPA: hypothetical protein VMX97_07690 [Hyphomicrobiaceae bacterium]|nr:hypothetical protein [Hyphomicrobiaceae bacterium]
MRKGQQDPDQSAAEQSTVTTGARWAGARLVWVLSGFFTGIAVWHFVGFWAFVGSVMLTGKPPSSPTFTSLVLDHSAQVAGPQAGTLHPRRDPEPASYVDGCVSLARALPREGTGRSTITRTRCLRQHHAKLPVVETGKGDRPPDVMHTSAAMLALPKPPHIDADALYISRNVPAAWSTQITTGSID